VAAVAEAESENVVPLSRFVWPQRSVLVVGNEYTGLNKHWLEQCDYRVTIPVAPGCDSLNVAVASGVLLFHMSCAASTLPTIDVANNSPT
jgi:tRNA G18 (ribose-2'-O)-methylase SpoU